MDLKLSKKEEDILSKIINLHNRKAAHFFLGQPISEHFISLRRKTIEKLGNLGIKLVLDFARIDGETLCGIVKEADYERIARTLYSHNIYIGMFVFPQ